MRRPKRMSRACSSPGTRGSPRAPSKTALASCVMRSRTSDGYVVPSREGSARRRDRGPERERQARGRPGSTRARVRCPDDLGTDPVAGDDRDELRSVRGARARARAQPRRPRWARSRGDAPEPQARRSPGRSPGDDPLQERLARSSPPPRGRGRRSSAAYGMVTFVSAPGARPAERRPACSARSSG